MFARGVTKGRDKGLGGLQFCQVGYHGNQVAMKQEAREKHSNHLSLFAKAPWAYLLTYRPTQLAVVQAFMQTYIAGCCIDLHADL